MTLAAGTRLGPYEITGALGAGGMGEVYRARDTKLGREVAIKVLPESVAQDAERLARFEREARTLASLNHPNIVTIFAVEESGGTRFLAMELVEGESLDTIIAPGGFPLSRFFEITVPLADALSAAHERGIVHRDLKPGNVMVTREGRVKVLDFGLAKLEGPGPGSDANLTSTPTESRANLTGEGQVFGTVAYMSPEQARGGKVDARSDVFSLGVMLYQLLTGERPFQGASAVDMISSILRDKPPTVTDLRADLPPHLARILRRCLEKDPRDRYQTSRDVYNELKELRAETSSSPSAPVSSPRSEAGGQARPPSGAARADEGFWVAVLPFKSTGASTELKALADGLSEEVVAGLSRFSYLRVITGSSTQRYADQSPDLRVVGKDLGARYVMNGSLRQVGGRLRVAVQLVDTTTGAHLWAENYERTFTPEAAFDLQDDLVPRIVSTVADIHGVLPRSMAEAVRSRPPDQLSPYEAVLRSFSYFERVTAEELAAARAALELAVRKAPDYADAWAMLALLCAQEYGQGFNLLPDSLASGSTAARRAVEAGPSNHLAHCSLAQVLFLQKEYQAFRNAAARAAALNPMDGATVALMGILLAYAGDWEHGCAVAEGAMRLNPHFPGWYRLATVVNAYRTRDYRAAIDAALRIQMPGYFWTPVLCAAAFGQLDEREAARKAVGELLAIRPEFGSAAREEFGKWHEPELVEHFIDGLRKAGLEIAGDPGMPGPAPAPSPADTKSGRIRADEGFWVAVLPFKHKGSAAELEALAEGMTEEILTGLSRFSYLRVIARGSPGDLHASGKELGARYVIEGSLRQAGTKLRVAVQLVDTTTGAHLWAETFDRAFKSEALFELQDELVPRIVSTIADQHGILVRSITAVIRNKADALLSPYEAVFRVFGLHERMSPQEHAAVRELLERVVRSAPDQSDCWAMLATLYSDEYMFGFKGLPDPLGRALAAAQRAVVGGPASPLASQALAQSLFFRRERQAFPPVAERTIALNPMDGATTAFMGILLACAGDWEHGCAVTDSAMRLNPHFPGWYWLAAVFNAYRTRDYRAAIDAALRIQMPGYFWTPAICAAAFGQLGQRQAAQKALEELLAIRPEFARAAREEFGKWFEPELVEHFIDGLHKAGLEIAAEGEAAAPAVERARSSADVSGAARADEGFWVAVLLFKSTGASTELKALADGLSEEVVAGLSRFSYLRVITGGSTQRYANQSPDLRVVGKELGARYVMNGNLRQVGARIRVAVQLVDAATGAQLWAETYERPFNPEAVFELQDDLVPRIVSTVADMHGVLPHSMSEAVRIKAPEQMSPYEALLRSFGYNERFTPEDHAEVRTCLERAVQQAPGNADCWAMLSLMYANEYGHWGNPGPGSLERALRAARTAVEAAPLSSLPYYALAQALFFRREIPAFRVAAERAVSLNPMDGATAAFMGLLIAYAGDWERGRALSEKGSQLNPNHPGLYRYTAWHDAYRKKDYRGALDVALKLNAPKNFYTHAVLAICYAQLGQMEQARKALRDLLALKPDYAQVARELHGRWIEPDLVEHLMDGLRKAGLDVAAAPGSAAPPGDAR